MTKVKFNSTCTSGTTCDCRQRTLTAAQTGLTPAATGGSPNTYELAIFKRDGHAPESDFQLTASGFLTTKSQCGPACGDGVVSANELCDCGNGSVPVPAGCPGPNNDSTYNGCTTMCTYGPFCGDGIVSGPEQCDNGSANNSVAYTPICNSGGCTPTCTLPHCCGDGIVDTDAGEQCDLGSANGPNSTCSSDCKVI